MNGLSLAAGSFCLCSGAALGCLFLLLKLVRTLLRCGRLATALLDIAFCLFCSAAVFLCALAIDKGRLRLAQAVLQALGAWGAIAALDPLVGGLSLLVQRAARRLAGWARRPVEWAVCRVGKTCRKYCPKRKKRKNSLPHRKKRKKTLEKLT